MNEPAHDLRTINRRRRLLFLLCIFVAAAVVGAVCIWQMAQMGLDQITVDLEDTFTLESWTTPVGTTAVSLPIATDDTLPSAAHVSVDLADFEPRTEQILADVVVNDPALPFSYRETRCYERTDAGLRRAEIGPTFWGEPQQLQSRYFAFRFFRRDGVAVAQAASCLDALYEQLVVLLQLNTAHTVHPIKVDVTSQIPATTLKFGDDGNQWLVIASPALMAIPTTIDDVDYLVQAATVPLVRLLIYDVIDNDMASQRWRPLIEWRGWLFWESGGPLSAWRYDVTSWLYADFEQWASLSLSDRPERYQQFCQMLDGFNLHPLDLSIPLLCNTDTTTAGAAVYIFSTNWPVALDDLAAPLACTKSGDASRLYCLYPPNIPSRLADLAPTASARYDDADEIRRLFAYRAQVVAMTTILEYVTEAYGLLLKCRSFMRSTVTKTGIACSYGSMA
ncbi:MAG: hypothetical protein R2856_16895 [Caldilineaceae bacterium]